MLETSRNKVRSCYCVSREFFFSIILIDSLFSTSFPSSWISIFHWDEFNLLYADTFWWEKQLLIPGLN